MKAGIRSAALAVLVSSILALAACGGGDDGDGGQNSSSNVSTSSPPCKPAAAGTKVNLTYTSWVPGAKKIVDLWNKQNPDIQVNYREVPVGAAGTYNNYQNALKSGQTDDLGFVEYPYLPTFRVLDGLQDVGNCPGVKEAASMYVPFTWHQATFGENGPVYAFPHDNAAMAYFYRKDLFDKYGLEPAKTWPEFLDLAKQIKARRGHAANVSAFGFGFFEGLVWQKGGGNWYSSDGSSWTVSIDNPVTREIAEYWQPFLDQDLVTKYDILSDEYNKAVNDDRMWGMFGASWTAQYIKAASPHMAGDWRVAPLPQWTPDDPSDGNWAGASLVVFKGSKHPAEAAKFALWLTTAPEAQQLNVVNGGVFPATTADAQTDVPALQEGTAYLGGQHQWQLFAQLGEQVPTDWTWGPTQQQAQQDLQDGLASALTGEQKLTDVFATLQARTVEAMKAASIPVSGS